MRVRAAFSVVSRMDEPILLVDEVLAVGDKRFREKCYERMESLVDHGRTLFLVSHSEKDLERFCKRGLYIEGGQVRADGPVADALAQYNADQQRK